MNEITTGICLIADKNMHWASGRGSLGLEMHFCSFFLENWSIQCDLYISPQKASSFSFYKLILCHFFPCPFPHCPFALSHTKGNFFWEGWVVWNKKLSVDMPDKPEETKETFEREQWKIWTENLWKVSNRSVWEWGRGLNGMVSCLIVYAKLECVKYKNCWKTVELLKQALEDYLIGSPHVTDSSISRFERLLVLSFSSKLPRRNLGA